tara:strand:- start:297 stop:509 length:213 start_codon:yes stop_codon:yes gene_type:complete
VVTKLLQLDTQVTEDFINGIESSNGPTRSTGTHLFLNDLLIARRDPDGQIFAVRKGMNAEAEAMLRDGDK